MDYKEALNYLDSFINYERENRWSYKESLKLERIKEFLNLLENPQDKIFCLHIAGTKGKGSTAAFTSYILKEAGFKVGLYTSPHLNTFRERIRILDNKKFLDDHSGFEGMISEKEVSDLVSYLKPYIESYNKNSSYGRLSFFEIYTTLAFLYFKEKKVDFLVLETGLGGRLDATNVVRPLVCGITSISYEHTQKLGSNLKEIAYEKAGIIKESIPVISAPQHKEVQQVIREKAKEMGAKLYELNKDIFFEKTRYGFNVLGIFREFPHLKIKLLGDHQLINATLAVGLIEALSFYNIIIGIEPIRNGLYNTIWPGRCEVVSKEPLIILDGAQNTASSFALKETIKKNFSYRKLILIFGICKDKDIKGVCDQLKEITDIAILTQVDNPRATKSEDLAIYFKDKSYSITDNVKTALKEAKRISTKDDLILITGSLFVVGEARAIILK
ncbi:MAG: bifunctional folylpolyglutamate synthase/dihydrofolate synthase [Candidatus Omnitrophica bacterium]|nr:bifunctional folylpolyglutamate synthase/dihydrofolate synthase [Candidatus Omnitrophota bacterium]